MTNDDIEKVADSLTPDFDDADMERRDVLRDERVTEISAVLRALVVQAYEEAAQLVERMGSTAMEDKRSLPLHPYQFSPADAIRALKDSLCQHDWIDARNEVVESSAYCSKCGAIRPVESVPS
jgi:hypothetical protein